MRRLTLGFVLGISAAVALFIAAWYAGAPAVLGLVTKSASIPATATFTLPANLVANPAALDFSGVITGVAQTIGRQTTISASDASAIVNFTAFPTGSTPAGSLHQIVCLPVSCTTTAGQTLQVTVNLVLAAGTPAGVPFSWTIEASAE